MAVNKYVDLTGLQVFKGLIEGKISDGDAKSLKTVLFDESNRKLNFYKKNAATSVDMPDFSIVLPEEQDISGLLEKITDGVKGHVVTIDEGGIIVDSGTALNDIAKKSEVEAVNNKVGDITKLSTTSKTDLVSAVNEVVVSVTEEAETKTVTIETETTTTGMLKSYTIKQGDSVIGTIDIPKDLVVTSGSVVADPEGQEPGTYIKLVIANQETPLYINVGKLVDIYTVKKNATQVQMSIDSATREISATIVAGSVGTTELANDAVTTVKIADANVTLAKLAVDVKNAFDSAGSATAAETNAKNYADGLNSSMDERVTELESKTSDAFTPITEEEINSIFSS